MKDILIWGEFQGLRDKRDYVKFKRFDFGVYTYTVENPQFLNYKTYF